MASRLARSLHRRQPSERLVPRAREDHRIVVHLIAAMAGLPDIPLPEIIEPPILGRCCTKGRSLRVPWGAAWPVGPVAGDGKQGRGFCAEYPSLALTRSRNP